MDEDEKDIRPSNYLIRPRPPPRPRLSSFWNSSIASYSGTLIRITTLDPIEVQVVRITNY